MHDNETAHGDIKPANILVVPSQEGSPTVRLIDFGFSSTPSDNSTKKLGTGLYMPPELLLKADDDALTVDEKYRYDYWALGLVLAEMLQKFGDNTQLDEFITLVLRTNDSEKTARTLLTDDKIKPVLEHVNSLLQAEFPSYDMNLLDTNPSLRRLKHKPVDSDPDATAHIPIIIFFISLLI